MRSFFAGVAVGLLALATGSLLPGIALHALVNQGSGWITYTAMRDHAHDLPLAPPNWSSGRCARSAPFSHGQSAYNLLEPVGESRGLQGLSIRLGYS